MADPHEALYERAVALVDEARDPLISVFLQLLERHLSAPTMRLDTKTEGVFVFTVTRSVGRKGGA